MTKLTPKMRDWDLGSMQITLSVFHQLNDPPDDLYKSDWKQCIVGKLQYLLWLQSTISNCGLLVDWACMGSWHGS